MIQSTGMVFAITAEIQEETLTFVEYLAPRPKKGFFVSFVENG